MIEPCHMKLAPELSSPANLVRRSRACAADAFRDQAVADALRASCGDSISQVDREKIAAHEAQAQLKYGLARDFENKHVAQMTKYQKAKPKIMNSIIAVVVAAEILSIPILLANIYMMVKKAPHTATLM